MSKKEREYDDSFKKLIPFAIILVIIFLVALFLPSVSRWMSIRLGVVPMNVTTTTTTPVNKTCTDSDGGLDYYTKGEVVVCTFIDGGGGCGGMVDYCTGDVLTEGYCVGSDSKTIKYTCPYGCEDGACLPPTITEEAVRLDTSSNRIILGEALNDARTAITKTDLPTLLADGVVIDDSNVSYPYTQDIQLNDNAHLYYSRSDNDLIDPVVHIEMEPVSGSPTYTTRVTFRSSLPVNSADVIFNYINLFGKDYAIGSNSDYNTLILYGGYNTYLLEEGESTTINVDGILYTVKVEGVSSATSGIVTVTKGSVTYTVEVTTGIMYGMGGLYVYVSEIYYYPEEGQVSSMKLGIGTSRILLENGDEVLLDASNYVDETLVTINGNISTNEISSFTVSTPAQDSDNDDIEVGEYYTDPVWGSFKLEFPSTNPSSITNDVILITGSSDTASIEFTDYGGYEKTIQFAYDNDTSAVTVTPYLMNYNSYEIHIKEGDRVYYKDYIVINKGDDTHLLQLTNIPSGEIKTTDTLRFTDVFAGDVILGHTFTTDEIGANGCEGGVGANVSMLIWSQDYNIMVCNATTKTDSYVEITWDDTTFYPNDTGADYGIPGYITFLPGIKAKNGEYVHFVNNYTKFNYGDVVILPGSDTGIKITVDNSSSMAYKIGQIYYIYDNTEGTIVPTLLKDYTTGIMVLEEERFNSTQHVIYVGITETGTVTKTVKVDRPSFSDTTSTKDGSGGVEYTTSGIDTNVSYACDAWGAMVKYYNKNEGVASIIYPDTQLYADIYIVSTPIPSKLFTVSDFSCAAIVDGYRCTISYTNNLGEEAQVVFLYMNGEGKVVSPPIPFAPEGSGTVGSAFYCTAFPTGNYMVSWRVYGVSDTTLSDPKAWCQSTDYKQITC